MTKEAFPRDMSQKIAVVAALRRGFEVVKHHQKFTKRMLPAFEKELPGYTVSLSVEPGDFGFARLRVWGNGLAYDDGVGLGWINSDKRPWQERMAEELDRNDVSDYAERQEQEIAIVTKLEAMEREIERIRAEASKIFEELPVPKSAKLRSNECHWSGPSYALRDKFPGLFKGDSR